MLAEGWPGGPEAATRAALARDLARAVGLSGMIAGQADDLAATDRALDFATLEFIHSHKTGALFMASAAGGGGGGAGLAPRSAPRSSPTPRTSASPSRSWTTSSTPPGSAGAAGKDVGKDVKKTTFVSFAGVEGARQLAGELIDTSEGGAARVRAAGPAAARPRALRRRAEQVM